MPEGHQNERPIRGELGRAATQGNEEAGSSRKAEPAAGSEDLRRRQEGGAGEPQTSPMEPEKQGGIGGK